MKNFKIDLRSVKEKYALSTTIENNALYCPNASEFYAKAYIENNYEDFRLIPTVKAEVRIAQTVFGGGGSVLKEFDCDFTAGDSTTGAIKLTPVSYSVMHEICQSDVESSFAVYNLMNSGSADWQEKEFFAHYWSMLAAKISEDISVAKWQGDVTLGLTGLEELITTSASTVGENVPFFTVSNVDDAIATALLNLPAAVSRNKKDLRIYVNSKTANMLAINAANGNTQTFITQELGMFYLGIKVSVQEGMSDNLAIITRKDNLMIGLDAIGDESNLKVRDLDVINVPKIRTRVDGKIALQIANDSEISYVEGVS